MSCGQGPEDIDRNGNGIFDQGDAFDIATTDSWDDNLPSGCQGTPFVSNGVTTDCYDGLRNFNQVRPACSTAAMPLAAVRANRSWQSAPTSSRR